jgi:hypothetical protein
LKGLGESKELPALQARLATALAKTDVPINSSCLCRTSAQSEQSCCYQQNPSCLATVKEVEIGSRAIQLVTRSSPHNSRNSPRQFRRRSDNLSPCAQSGAKVGFPPIADGLDIPVE